MRLKDKVIIVTGAARGLGQEFCLGLAREGAVVAAVDRISCAETVAKVEAAGGRCAPFEADVTGDESVRAMAAGVNGAFGRIDGLVNNAAVYATLKMAPFDEIAETEWDSVMNVNAKGVWLCSRAVFPYMKARGAGSIVSISSASIFEGNPYFAHYVASKGAVWALSRSISRSVGAYNIRANTVTPGYTMTEASKNLAGDPESYKKNYEDNIAARAIKRAMEPGDVVGAVVFLLSDDASFITGQNLNVDGGSIIIRFDPLVVAREAAKKMASAR